MPLPEEVHFFPTILLFSIPPSDVSLLISLDAIGTVYERKYSIFYVS